MGLKKRGKLVTSSNSPETIEKTRTLTRNIELCRKYKQETASYVKKISEQHRKGIFSYAEYEYILNRYLKGQTLEYWTQHYEAQEKKIQEKIKDLKRQKPIPLEKEIIKTEKKSWNLFAYILITLILVMGIAFAFYQTPWLGNLMTGLAVGEPDSFIQRYSPDYNPEIQVGEAQTFTITTLAPENTSLSVQWYVNNLPLAEQTSEEFSYAAEEPGEYEIKVLVNDLQNYTTQKWTLTVQEKEFTLPVENVTTPEENITEPVNETLPENVTEPVEEPQPEEVIEPVNETIPENITEPIGDVLPEENITLPENITELIDGTLLENITGLVVELADELIQLPAEINKPVQWIRTIKNENQSTTLEIQLPITAKNIKAKKIQEILGKEIKLSIPEDKIKIKDTTTLAGYSVVSHYSTNNPILLKYRILNFIKRLFSFTGFTIIEPIQTQTQILVIEEPAKKYEIIYETPAPKVEETELKSGKRITVYSDIGYENVSAYTTIKEIPREGITFYWVKEEGREVFEEVNYTDTNNDSLIDRLEWVVPHLSEQTFEVEITILNVQSYPTVGGNWTVEFTTKGIANLTIKAVNETTWSDANEDNDLKFLEIKCGNESLGYSWVNDSVFIEDYNCEEIGYETSKVLTPGKHTLEFEFGTKIAYAHNLALPDCGSGCWYVKDNSGTSLLAFGAADGNLNIAGQLIEDIDTLFPSAVDSVGTDGNGHLIFKDSSGTIVAWVNKVGDGGDLNIFGSLSQSVDCASPATDSFQIRDNAGNIKLFIETDGDMCIEGALTENA